MEDLSPSRAAGIDLLVPNDHNKPDNNSPRRKLIPKPAPRILPDPILDADADKEQKHQLDELA